MIKRKTVDKFFKIVDIKVASSSPTETSNLNTLAHNEEQSEPKWPKNFLEEMNNFPIELYLGLL